MVAKRKTQTTDGRMRKPCRRKAPPDDIFIRREEGGEIFEENAQRLLGMSALASARR